LAFCKLGWAKPMPRTATASITASPERDELVSLLCLIQHGLKSQRICTSDAVTQAPPIFFKLLLPVFKLLVGAELTKEPPLEVPPITFAQRTRNFITFILTLSLIPTPTLTLTAYTETECSDVTLICSNDTILILCEV